MQIRPHHGLLGQLAISILAAWAIPTITLMPASVSAAPPMPQAFPGFNMNALAGAAEDEAEPLLHSASTVLDLDAAAYRDRPRAFTQPGGGSRADVDPAALRVQTQDFLPRSPAQMNALLEEGQRLLLEAPTRVVAKQLVGIGGQELRQWLTRIYRIRLVYSRIMTYESPDGWIRHGAVKITVVPDDKALWRRLSLVRDFEPDNAGSVSGSAFHDLTWPMQDFRIGEYHIHAHPGRGGETGYRLRAWLNDHPVIAYYQGPPTDPPRPRWIFIGKVEAARRDARLHSTPLEASAPAPEASTADW
ncbi:uncharacterized protein PFL1_05949 [Pseudozyma flocculosa PF-1]|uniref:Uncharacterized protein n=2 Tax=Pseudozyma flocculosa TaxID=84751 RepID=A0A5C3F373_9BASI|nr:uncharacterized protein PFL1_05949 [Pseudozyma flocculosa PF-1]EPQ26628.1 hypothetical protein PFL1_05949 [Pseudozyma flocculosa PF-1]SPO38376.1 uncharacterized protein PSFLO_03853 [Pseudozyma flocculosa]